MQKSALALWLTTLLVTLLIWPAMGDAQNQQPRIIFDFDMTTAEFIPACARDPKGCHARMSSAEGFLENQRGKTYCPPLAMSWNSATVNSVISWLSAHPQLGKEKADDAIAQALKELHPCK